MSEYPWDFENMVLGEHDQPCDCALCDEIHFNRAIRKKRMKEMINYCDKKHSPMNIGCAYCEIDKLREENERFKIMYKGFENQAVAIMSLTAERDRYREALEAALRCLENNWSGQACVIDIIRDSLRGEEVENDH